SDLREPPAVGNFVAPSVGSAGLEPAPGGDAALELAGEVGRVPVELPADGGSAIAGVGAEEPEDEHLDPVDGTARRGGSVDDPGRRRVVAEPVALNLLPLAVSSTPAACKDEGCDEQRFGAHDPRKGAV